MQHDLSWETKHTSIMHATEGNQFIPEINLLYVDYGVSTESLNLPVSKHNFWQMELVFEGTIFAHVENSRKILSEGEIKQVTYI